MQPATAVPRFHLPFDGARPTLVCGNPEAGVSTFARHLVAGLPARTVFAIISTAATFDFEHRDVTTLRPADEENDAAFFARAEHLVQEAISTPGSVLIVDDCSILAAPYSNPMPGQGHFLARLNAALQTARTRGVRIVLCSAVVPGAAVRAHCGAQIWVGPANPVEWGQMFGKATMPKNPAPPAGTETDHGYGGGIYFIDGVFTGFRFPYDSAAQGEPDLAPHVTGPANRTGGRHREVAPGAESAA